jgi:hypothetical protein
MSVGENLDPVAAVLDSVSDSIGGILDEFCYLPVRIGAGQDILFDVGMLVYIVGCAVIGSQTFVAETPCIGYQRFRCVAEILTRH